MKAVSGESIQKGDHFKISKDDLLKEWLGVAESQICSLMVLCTQVPKLNQMLEENMQALSESFCALADQAQLQVKNIDSISSSFRHITVADKQITIADALKNVMKTHGEQLPIEVVDEIGTVISEVESQQSNLEEYISIVAKASQDMSTAVSRAIVGMQFQDRVSQNLVIAENVAKENVMHLKENIDKTIAKYSGDSDFFDDNGSISLDIEFSKRLIKLLTLGELQHQFVNHLVENGYIASGDEIDFGEDNSGHDVNDDVELF